MKRLQQPSIVYSSLARLNNRRPTIHPTPHPRFRAEYSLQNSPINSSDDHRNEPIVRNAVGVQLLPRSIHRQIFPRDVFPPPSERAIQLSKEHLSRHGLAKGISDPIEAPLFSLPSLQGETIDQHFVSLGVDRSEPYLSNAKIFSLSELPSIPTNWSQLPGWTIYHSDGSFEAIDHPPESEKALVMDVETFPAHTQCAIMATAVSSSSWYSWLSPWLVGKTDQPDNLIPMPSKTHRLIVGHHVGFDRARIQQEYSLRATRTRFLDTMSLHIATFGLSNPQRPAYMFSKKKALSNPQNIEEHDQENSNTPSDEPSNVNDFATGFSGLEAATQTSWTDVASMNSLEEVAKLHCGIQVDKTLRNIFLENDKSQIVRHIPQLLEYCARDVSATHAVYCKLLPLFLEQCPHPVSFAGMLHMGNPFLPVDETWQTYLERSESAFLTKSTTVKASLLRLAEATRKLMFVKDPKTGRPIYEDDHWLKQLDWTPKKARWTSLQTTQDTLPGSDSIDSNNPSKPAQDPKKMIPAWFANLQRSRQGDAFLIAPESPLAALLLKVKYQGHPVLWSRKLGWLFGSIIDPNAPPSSLPTDEIDLREVPEHVELYENERIFKLPSSTGQSTKRVRTLLSRNNSKLFDKDILSSPYPEAHIACRIAKTSDVSNDLNQGVYDRLLQLAEEAKTLDSQSAKLDPWLRQLDWTPVMEESDLRLKDVEDSSPDHQTTGVDQNQIHKSSKSLKLPEEDKVWPHWYWLLARRGIDNIGLTTKSQMTPLLLRLSFCGFPLYRSKQHGWVFRIPSSELKDPYLSRVPLTFNFERDPMFVNDQEGAVFFKVPHPDGDSENVGSPLSKSFDKAFENEVLRANPLCIDHSSANLLSDSAHVTLKAADSHALADNARQALSMSMQCSYWLNASQRIKDQMVIWESSLPQENSDNPEPSRCKQGLILPQVTVMGTITRRATEKTWLAAANAKKNKIGTELKSMIRAPPGYAIVGADVDSEELWISSVMGDAQFGMHGATAIGWMTLEGTKVAGTDLHSKTASILGISRNDAKVFNYSRIYGAGIAHAVQLLMKADPTASKTEATKLAKQLYASTKGVKNYRADMFERKFWYGGTESYLFNKLEQIALAEYPETPALNCGITRALRKCHLPSAGEGPDFMTSRVNWAVQSSGVDYLHMLIVAMDYLTDRYGIDARYMISVHDEIRYLSAWEDRYRCALALQIANLWTRCQFAFKLEMDDLPQSCAWFSAVDVDHVLRKEVDLSCVTPSNPDPIPPGESLDINKLLQVTPMGLGELKKPLEVSDSSTGDFASLYKSNIALKHRSTQLEWLAAQSSQDRDEIRKHWHRAQHQEEQAWVEHELRQRAPPAPAKKTTSQLAPKDTQPLYRRVPIPQKVQPSSPSYKPRPSRPSRQVPLNHTRKNGDDDPDLSAWKAFDASQSVNHPLDRL
ncbi:uncharacterized protein PGTG_09156 [Puccinia graminis f. sp. tritici CRL 75-36-700-3]|uniref:Mitochondrial DNA polymerase catalytic subunit n=1 Tax=Puccinia graminis f. sp. tritici (strain CRL 75-36-700-3 / race SCCL) TaxID=418459 RepID=E3KFR8_PUCGT|nr:uncharacterized protein PGTG_09156 [Puccinia graminis f. sp. tritici CRL 75-36-700-3]EFP83203.2 hypothetical protein PGTG_09156 [Puccinia graminis f. sp. tritici CRL 75-36-700-3]